MKRLIKPLLFTVFGLFLLCCVAVVYVLGTLAGGFAEGGGMMAVDCKKELVQEGTYSNDCEQFIEDAEVNSDT
ncbi:hypothetical protein EOPP23_16910 [Endozoicomonas sp. OPT23]|uniref:hypothetical protein n=1 Tax=Endozoicomonas sp. OPT23 TaxID=2072845 RepID=UPI00129BDD16|nr:hypothetical protein [Endozoicomonas sp. OPT23]MRI34666.1 hypothetical protein [Endozoicomonas sp. OPT23]